MDSIAEFEKENKYNEHENSPSCESALKILGDTGEVLVDIGENGKERPWRKHKSENEKLVELFQLARQTDERIISLNRLDSLNECASFLLFDRNEQQRLRLHRANFCRVRLCPMCSWRKSLKLFGQVSKIVDVLMCQQPTTRFIFVTLTVPNCTGQELTGTINKMNKAFTYLTSNRRTFAPAKILKENLLGYMKAMEITYNQKTDTYHPHIHCLFAVKADYFMGRGYIRKDKWQGIWSRAMHSDRMLIVHVETIKNTKAKAVAEVAKYPVKPADILKIRKKKKAVAALIVLHSALHKRRLVTFGGLLADIKKQLGLEDVDSENADLVHADDETSFTPVEQVMFRWCKIGAYICY